MVIKFKILLFFQVWKANVNNTPKTLKALLGPFLIKLIELSVVSEDVRSITTGAIKDFASQYTEGWMKEILDSLDQRYAECEASSTRLRGFYFG